MSKCNKKDEYRAYLRSDRWNKKRIKILKRDGFQCAECLSKHNLQVHHLTYDRLFMENDNDLITLCGVCHAEVHKERNAYYTTKKGRPKRKKKKPTKAKKKKRFYGKKLVNSDYVGVFNTHSKKGSWRAEMIINGCEWRCYYDTEKEAAKAYDLKLIEIREEPVNILKRKPVQ